MGLSLSTEPTVNFNPDATYTQPHQNAGSVNGAIKESGRTGQAIEAALKDIGSKLSTEMKDGGLPNNSGGVGFFTKAIAGIAAAGMGGPVGAVAGAALAVSEGLSFLQKPAQGDEPTSFKDYSKTKYGRATPDEERYAADKLANYECAADQKIYTNGFAQPRAAGFAMAPGRNIMPDDMEERLLQRQYATLKGKAEDHREQDGMARVAARDNNMTIKDFAGGPKPPSGGPGFVSAPGMG